MNKLYLLIISSLPVLFSCTSQNKGSTVKEIPILNDTVDTRVEVYDSTGQVRNIFHQKKGLKHGPETQFYSNNIEKQKGSWFEGHKIGWFEYYEENEKLQVKRQYVQPNGNFTGQEQVSHLNQVIRFNRQGDTVKSGSFYYTLFTTGDTIKNGSRYAFKLVLSAPMFKNAWLVLCSFDETETPGAICDTFLMENFQIAKSPREYRLGQNIIEGLILNFESFKDSTGQTRQRTARIYFVDRFFVVD